MDEAEIDYARRREREERLASADAIDANARDAHLVMAERYADRAWSIEEG